jgi:hypothetical protein
MRNVSLRLLESWDDLSSWPAGGLSFPSTFVLLPDSSSASRCSSSRLASSGVSNVAGLASEMHNDTTSNMTQQRQIKQLSKKVITGQYYEHITS